MSLRGSRVNEEDAILSKKKFKEEDINPIHKPGSET
jgi:hypothetical protein